MTSTLRILFLCDDCTMAECNGDFSGMAAPRAAEVKAAFNLLDLEGGHLTPHFDSETGEGIDEFSRQPCGVCGCGLAGGRHRFIVMR